MRNPILAAFAVLTILAGPAAAQSDLAEREAAARRLLDPMLDQMAAGMFAGIRREMETGQFSPEESAALGAAFEAEAAVVSREIKDRVIAVVVRNVPLAELNAESGMNTPGWDAAGREIETSMREWGMRRGAEMMIVVLERGCKATDTPSPSCAQALAHIEDIRAGRVKIEDMMEP